MEIFIIEARQVNVAGGIEYRFRSLYNSCIGSWQPTEKLAIKQGIVHQYIIELNEGRNF